MTDDGRVKASPSRAPNRRRQRHRPQPRARIGSRRTDRQIGSGEFVGNADAAAVPAISAGRWRATDLGRPAASEDVEMIPLSRMRRAIADGTVRSKSNTPHFYVTVEADVEPLLALRKEINSALADRGVKVSVNDMLIKALALTLREFPNLNTHYYGDRFVLHQRVNIGISVAMPENGLVNVVCPDADRISLSEMALNNKAMYERARSGKIKPDDIRGATFTISNLGPFNVKGFLGDYQFAGSRHPGGIVFAASTDCARRWRAGRGHAHEYDAERRSPRQQWRRGRSIYESPARAG